MESLVFDEHGTLAEAMEVPSYKWNIDTRNFIELE
jgi:hypothetical protein